MTKYFRSSLSNLSTLRQYWVMGCSQRRVAAFFGALAAILVPATASAQYQVPGDYFYQKVDSKTFVLKTQYAYNSPSGSANRMVIEIASGWLDDQSRVQVFQPYAQNGSVNGKVQEWLFIPSGRIEGQMSYYIINRWHRKYMQASGLNGQVCALAHNGQLNQKWFIDIGPFGEKFVRSASNGLYLTFPAGNNGANVTMQPLNLGTTQQITIDMITRGHPLWAFNWNYLKPTVIHLADNPNLVFGDSTQSSSSVQNQVVVLQNRVAGANYQVWEPHTEAWIDSRNIPIYSNQPGDDGFRLVKRWTSFTIAPWNNFGMQGYGITTRFWEANPGEQQRWYAVVGREEGQYNLVHAASGLTLQPQFNGPGALLVLVPFGNASSQNVILETLQ